MSDLRFTVFIPRRSRLSSSVSLGRALSSSSVPLWIPAENKVWGLGCGGRWMARSYLENRDIYLEIGVTLPSPSPLGSTGIITLAGNSPQNPPVKELKY